MMASINNRQEKRIQKAKPNITHRYKFNSHIYFGSESTAEKSQVGVFS